MFRWGVLHQYKSSEREKCKGVCVFGPTFQHCVFGQETDLTGGLILDVKAQSRSKLHSRADESSLHSHSQGSMGRKKMAYGLLHL